jgi:hypothetical protein
LQALLIIATFKNDFKITYFLERTSTFFFHFFYFQTLHKFTKNLLTGHYQEREPANISSFAAVRQTQVWRDVLKELCMDDQGLEICQVPE